MSQDQVIANPPNVEPVEVWFKLIKGADGYPESQDWEELWATPSGGAFRLDSSPFFENRVSKGDVVTASIQGEGFLQFERVVERGGHSTFRALVDPERGDVDSLMAELRRLGAECEVTLDHLVAVDVPPKVFEAVEDFLVKGKEAEKWGLQDGFIFEQPVVEQVPGQ